MEVLNRYDFWFLQIGEGRIPTVTPNSDNIIIPDENCLQIIGQTRASTVSDI